MMVKQVQQLTFEQSFQICTGTIYSTCVACWRITAKCRTFFDNTPVHIIACPSSEYFGVSESLRNCALPRIITIIASLSALSRDVKLIFSKTLKISVLPRVQYHPLKQELLICEPYQGLGTPPKTTERQGTKTFNVPRDGGIFTIVTLSMVQLLDVESSVFAVASGWISKCVTLLHKSFS